MKKNHEKHKKFVAIFENRTNKNSFEIAVLNFFKYSEIFLMHLRGFALFCFVFCNVNVFATQFALLAEEKHIRIAVCTHKELDVNLSHIARNF